MTRPLALFVCVHNAGRSQMAAGFLEALAGDRVEVRSAGSEPAAEVNAVAVAAMAEVGIDIAGRRPRVLADDDARRADVVITMGCGDTCPYHPGTRYEDWPVADPAGRPLDDVREIRDAIRARVERLVDELAPRLVPLTEERWPEVEAIYRAGIATGHATFETEPPGWAAFAAIRSPDLRWVALGPAGRVLGWVAAQPVSDRCAYAGVVEHSVYVDPGCQGRGIGRLLLDRLVAATEAAGVWTIQSGVFPENLASLRVHEAAGFRVVGTRSRVGRMTCGPMAGRWRDVVAVERRSEVAGADEKE